MQSLRGFLKDTANGWLIFAIGLTGGWIISTAPGWLRASRLEDWWNIATAVATVLAVVVALGIAIYQDLVARAARRREPLWSLDAVVRRGAYLISRIPCSGHELPYVESYFRHEASVSAVNSVQRALHAFPIQTLADYSAIQAVFEMQDALHIAIEVLETILPAGHGLAEKWTAKHAQIQTAQYLADIAIARLRVALDGAGASTS